MVEAVPASGHPDIDALLWGYRWSVLDLTYAFPADTAEYLDNGYAAIEGFAPFSAEWQAAARAVMVGVMDVTGLVLTETPPDSIATFRWAGAAELNYSDDATVLRYTGWHYPGGSGTAEGNPPELAHDDQPPLSAPFAQGDMWFYPPNYPDIRLGTYGYTAGLMHEFGHALGLKHGHVEQEAHGDLFPALPRARNSFEYSVMTYHQYVGDRTPGDSAQHHPTTFMQADIAALQYLYGANFGTNAGDTVYRWDPATGAFLVNDVIHHTPWANYVLMTVWDGGGIDAYDLGAYTADLRIDLAPGAFSRFGTAQLADLGDGHAARGNVANALLYLGDERSLIEDAIGGTGKDTLAGNAVANHLQGGTGNDWLEGREGDDTLDGQGGDDLMRGGVGDDTYIRDSAGDRIVEAADAGTDLVVASVTTRLAANIEDLLLAGTAAIRGIGNARDNWITGNDAANRLDGGAGADTLQGAAGNDVYRVDSPDDVIVETDGDRMDLVLAVVDFSLTEGVSVEVLQAAADAGLSLAGNAADNRLLGAAGADTLAGGAGNDLLQGGAGADLLTGGAGRDIFLLGADPAHADTIADFTSAGPAERDRIQLDSSSLTSLAPMAGGGLLDSLFVANIGAAATATALLIYDTLTGDLFYDADASGTAETAFRIATFSNGVALRASDFLVA
jgi:serralysin